MKGLLKTGFVILFILLITKLLYSQKEFNVDSLKMLLTETEVDSVQSNIYNQLSYEFLHLNKDSSLLYAKYALSLSKKNNYEKGVAEALLNFGRISNIEGNFENSINYFMKAMANFKKLKDSIGIIKSYYGLGLTYFYFDDLEKSLEYTKHALTLSESINKKDVYYIYNNTGLVYMKLEQIDSALYYFEKAIVNATEFNNTRSVMYSYGNIANLYLDLKNYQKALEIFMMVKDLSEKTNNRVSLTLTLLNISVSYNGLALETQNKSERNHFFKESAQNAEEALAMAEEFNSLTHMNYSYLQLLRSYKELKDYKKAFEYSEKYISTNDSIYNIEKIKEVEKIEKRFKSEQQKIKIESITKEKELKEDIIKKQDQIILLVILALFIILILLIFVFILYKNKKNANILLNQKNEAIRNQRSEIASQRDNLSELAFELKKTNKTKDKYFSVLAHDLKNPFQSIIGFSELLKQQVSEGDFNNTEKYADYIYETSHKTYALLENLLNWARVQRGVLKYQPKIYNLCELINEIIDLSEGTANSKDITLLSKADRDLNIYVDKYMFSTIIRNLISNAVKFTQRGGKITIESAIGKSGLIDVLVKDTGIGIKKENISRIFKLDHSGSVTGTEEETGTGLGLLVCKEFTEKNQGSLKVESTEGKGSTFIVSIPSNEN